MCSNRAATVDLGPLRIGVNETQTSAALFPEVTKGGGDYTPTNVGGTISTSSNTTSPTIGSTSGKSVSQPATQLLQ